MPFGIQPIQLSSCCHSLVVSSFRTQEPARSGTLDRQINV